MIEASIVMSHAKALKLPAMLFVDRRQAPWIAAAMQV